MEEQSNNKISKKDSGSSHWFGDWSGGFDHLVHEMDKLLTPFRKTTKAVQDWGSTDPWWAYTNPACDIDETDKEYRLKLDMPGIDKEEIDIKAKGNQLIVTAERDDELVEEDEPGVSVYKKERSHSSYRRIISFPDTLKPEGIEANYVNGVLAIIAPKMEQTNYHAIKIH